MRLRLRDIEHRVRLPRQPAFSILDAINDVFAPWFRNRESWRAWFAFLAALFALDMSKDQLATFKKHTGRTDAPLTVAKEAWLICGRRAGKSFMLALVAVFLAAFHDYRKYLVPGERGVVLVIARDRAQAKVIFNYVKALLTHVPVLSRLIDSATKESIHLTNDVSIQVATASFKSVRGRTTVAALIDELAYFPVDEAADPDVELLAAIRPSMLTIPNSMLLVASSPYARRGEVYNTWKDHFGKDGPILVWKATTREMNPMVPQSEIDAALAKDPARYTAEYLAEFRTDVEALFTREAIEECIPPGIRERPYIGGSHIYSAFVDPSGGASDSFTIAIAHKEGQGAILDVLRERKPPFSPEAVVEEFCQLLKSYRIAKVVGDRYGGEWPRERFLKYGISYEVSKQSKSDIYQAFVPLVLGKRADLLDNDRLLNQLVGLERRTARGGRDSIDHGPGGHDDVANVAAGALTNLISNTYDYDVELRNVCRREDEKQSSTVSAISNLSNIMGGRFW